MNKINIALHLISFTLIALLSWKVFGGKSTSSGGAVEISGVQPYAFINSDTLTAKFKYVEDRGVALAQKEAELQEQLDEKVRRLEKRFGELQRKSDIMTQAELAEAQEELQRGEQEISLLRSQLAQQLDAARFEMQLELYKQVEDVLTEMAENKGLTTIFSYTQGGQLLYIDPSLDLTNSVLRTLNENYEKQAEE